jgi:hypothetical protein
VGQLFAGEARSAPQCTRFPWHTRFFPHLRYYIIQIHLILTVPLLDCVAGFRSLKPKPPENPWSFYSHGF